MAQVAYIDITMTEAHLVVGVSSAVTLCGRVALLHGDWLPVSTKRWPKLPWCQPCRDAYRATPPLR
ncbi:MAG: hypothetical protein ABR571_03715 [Jatrophihabitans sp.]|uniref:hypothetical protein n=1 Tax=Jatrophihabitans sp. TaxID=1932789 RepID=UPI003914CE2E